MFSSMSGNHGISIKGSSQKSSKNLRCNPATFLPVFLGVGEHEMKRGHQENVSSDEEEKRKVVPGPEAVGEQNQDE